jgi:hypothetical protein
MPLIDDRGRLFGRVNVIDAALVLLVVVMIPVGYAAYRLLRTPVPRLEAVTPQPLPYKKGEQRIRITGENFRPFLRVTVGPADAKAFLVEKRDAAEVVFGELPPGTYDVTLFDYAEELTRLKNGLTIVPPPSLPVQIVGHVIGSAAGLATGAKLAEGTPAPLEVIAAPKPDGRGALLRATCNNGPCAIGGAPVTPGQRIDLHVTGSANAIGFVVDELRVDGIWADARVRLFGLPEVLDLIKANDVDIFLDAEQAVRPPPGVTGAAVVRSVGPIENGGGSMSLSFGQGLPDDFAGFSAGINGSVQMPMKGRTAIISIPVERQQSGLRYRKQFVRPGSGMTFVTANYLLRAWIMQVMPPEVAPAIGAWQ